MSICNELPFGGTNSYSYECTAVRSVLVDVHAAMHGGWEYCPARKAETVCIVKYVRNDKYSTQGSSDGAYVHRLGPQDRPQSRRSLPKGTVTPVPSGLTLRLRQGSIRLFFSICFLQLYLGPPKAFKKYNIVLSIKTAF